MRKIRTIFERENNKVVDKLSEGVDLALLNAPDTIATEKLDGMNVRATIRSSVCVRLEKRRNPDKIQKHNGIIEPWYIDTAESSEDKWLNDALKNTDLTQLPDGEWSGEALGPNIQGNPLNLESNRIVFFSLNQAPIFENVPTTFAELKDWLPQQQSKYGTSKIEGIVWHCANGEMYKIKLKDF